MTDPTRGARVRRGARRPGWILMTALLVLAIGASSALVFTNRVELLKLAVLLALWAAVVAAFVSVIYRRQSDSDQAKARDLKLVYDLQLDREISARREYELAVETQLRRELTSELRRESSGEVTALRAELAALRANLEYLFDTDLSHRRALETDQTGPRAIGEWAPATEAAGRVSISRIDTEDVAEHVDDSAHTSDAEESSIIDVPAEPHPPEAEPESWVSESSVDGARGAHRRFSEEAPVHAHRAAQEGSGRRGEAPPPPPPSQPPPQPRNVPPSQPEPDYPWLPPPASSASPSQASRPEPAAPAAAHWQPAPSEGQWIPPGTPGSHWAPSPANIDSPAEYVGRRRAADAGRQEHFGQAPPAAEPPRGRHSGTPLEGGTTPEGGADRDATQPPVPPTPAPPVAEPDEDADGGAHAGGQSVAELMARLQATQSGGGRRRRRED